MTRQRPLGFLFGVSLEIAAVALIVTLLPRVDLRPKDAAAGDAGASPIRFAPPHSQPPPAAREASRTDPAVLEVAWNDESLRSGPSVRQSAYDERPSFATEPSPPPAGLASRPAPPPLVQTDPGRVRYVEDRLDRASQQLVSSVGSFITDAASNVLSPPAPAAVSLPAPPAPSVTRYAPQPPNSITPALTPSFPTAAAAPPARTQPAPAPFQPRPWMRY
jgi:hypothetical protein